MAETWPWPDPRAAWADVAVALRAVAAQPERPSGRPPAHYSGVRPIRQIIHGLWKSSRLSEDGAAEALALSLVVPTWTAADGVPVEDIFSRCELILDNLDDSSPNKPLAESGRWRAAT
jgi:hypothetical protein